MKLKNYGRFFEEISIRDKHPSFPDRYINDVENRSRQEIQRQGYNTDPRQLGGRLMGLARELGSLCRGKEEELSEFAHKVIYDLYKDVIDRYEIELDLKIVEPNRLGTLGQESEGCESCDDAPRFREIVDQDIRNEIFKRKVLNLITQGEGKNAKYVLHLPEIKEGIIEILGQRNGERAVGLMDEISKMASAMDWILPYEVQSHMIEENPVAGFSKTEWKPKEINEYDPSNDNNDEEGDYEEDDEDDQPMENLSSTPVVKARAVDFVLLLHEAIKGIYRILFTDSVPEDKEVAKKVEFNTGPKDEPEDWRYGPKIASDLRDFVNNNKKIDKYPNVREELYKVMADKKTMPTAEFLELMRGIVSKEEGVEEKIDKLIDKAIENIEEFRQYQKDMEQYHKDMEKYNRDVKDWEESQKRQQENPTSDEDGDTIEAGSESGESDIDRLIRNSASKNNSKSEDPSTWSRKEIQDALDSALDDGDFEKAKYYGSFLRESFSYGRGR